MASKTLVAHGFAEGTSVSAWPAENLTNGGAPSGTPVDTSPVASGALTFDGLTAGRRYVAYAAGRAVRFFMEEGSLDLAKPIRGSEAATVRAVATDMAVVKEAAINVDAAEHGGLANDLQDNTAAYASAIAKLGGKAGRILIPPGLRKGHIALPTWTPTTGHEKVIIEGYGATLKPTSAAPIIARALPADQTAAGLQNNTRFILAGMRFLGTGTAGEKGIRLAASHSPIFRDLEFMSLDDGLELIWCMNALIENVLGNSNVKRTIKLLNASTGDPDSPSALWTGTNSSLGCNAATIRGVRDYCSSGQLASFYIGGSDMVRIVSAISEGLNPVRAVDFVHGSFARKLHIEDFWSENFPSSEIIRAPVFNRLTVKGLRLTDGATVAINADGSTAGAVIRVEDMPYFPTATAKFRHGTGTANHRWVFNDVGAGIDMTGAFWDLSASGVAPITVDQDTYDSALMGDRYPTKKTTRQGFTGALRAGIGKLLLNTAVSAASVENNSLFRDSADGKVKWKDNAGVTNALY